MAERRARRLLGLGSTTEPALEAHHLGPQKTAGPGGRGQNPLCRFSPTGDRRLLWFLRQIDQLIRTETAKPQAMNFSLAASRFPHHFRFLLPNILPLWTVKREERLK